jgi:hypothetical protein
MNGDMNVYSFVASNPVTSFNAEVKEFWDYLTDNYSYPADSQYLLSKFLADLLLLSPKISILMDLSYAIRH